MVAFSESRLQQSLLRGELGSGCGKGVALLRMASLSAVFLFYGCLTLPATPEQSFSLCFLSLLCVSLLLALGTCMFA